MGCRGGYTATCCSVINFKEGTIVADIDDWYHMVGIDWIVMKGPDVGRESREWIATYGKEGHERALRLAHLLITTPEVVGPGEREASTSGSMITRATLSTVGGRSVSPGVREAYCLETLVGCKVPD